MQQCIQKLKEVHPDLYPVWYIEHNGVYLFNLLKRGVNKENAISNLYAIKKDNGVIAGPFSPLDVYSNPDISAKLDNPHYIDPSDQKPIEHGYVTPSTEPICHHGIKGQKWGVRRFQNEDGTLTPEGKERYYKGDGQPGFFEKQRIKKAELADRITSNFEKEDLTNIVDRNKSKETKVRVEDIATDIALTIINPLNAAYLAADGIGAIAAKVKTNNYFKKRPEKSELDSETGLYMKKEGSYTDKQDIAAINPGYLDLTQNTKSNCMLCSTTYDMRKRGYDVTAQLDSEGYSFPDLKRWYPKAELKTNTRYDENGHVLKQKEYVQKSINNLLSQGEGARGNIMLWFGHGCGHSIAYEIKDGKLMFIDGQSGQVYKQGKSSALNTSTPESFLNKTLVNSYARLDNIDPDIEKIIKECVR